MMAKAFIFMRKKAVAYATDETIEQLAKDYEEAMKEAAEASSKARKGKKHSEEAKKKIAEAHKGKKHSEEAKKKIGEANKGKHTGEKNPMYGKHFSEETLKKLSEAKKEMHWFNNGEKCVRAKECPEGFVPGRIK